MEIGCKVICVTSFEAIRSVWGFDYPYAGDILTVIGIDPHPNKEVRANGIVCLFFKEKPTLCPVCDKQVDGTPNFIPIDEKSEELVDTIEIQEKA
jgi:hypothetical protein